MKELKAELAVMFRDGRGALLPPAEARLTLVEEKLAELTKAIWDGALDCEMAAVQIKDHDAKRFDQSKALIERVERLENLLLCGERFLDIAKSLRQQVEEGRGVPAEA